MGVPQSYELAAYYSKKAAEQDHAEAQSRNGFFYLLGIRVPQDYEQALHPKSGSSSTPDRAKSLK